MMAAMVTMMMAKRKIAFVLGAGVLVAVAAAGLVDASGRGRRAGGPPAVRPCGGAAECLGPGRGFVDEDGDGICDRKGECLGGGFVDEDGDGICDRKAECKATCPGKDGACPRGGCGTGEGCGLRRGEGAGPRARLGESAGACIRQCNGTGGPGRGNGGGGMGAGRGGGGRGFGRGLGCGGFGCLQESP